jgi:hypothetical protein
VGFGDEMAVERRMLRRPPVVGTFNDDEVHSLESAVDKLLGPGFECMKSEKRLVASSDTKLLYCI